MVSLASVTKNSIDKELHLRNANNKHYVNTASFEQNILTGYTRILWYSDANDILT